MRTNALKPLMLAGVSALALSCANGESEQVVSNQHDFDAAQQMDVPKTKDAPAEAVTKDSTTDTVAPEANAGPDSTSLCDPSSCGGCCRTGGACASGTEDDACGTGGASCADCSALGTVCAANACVNCTPACAGKLCGEPNGCGSTCKTGSGCCDATCKGKSCGADNGCGQSCQEGSGCCTPVCGGKECGEDDDCGGTCEQGSGCCDPVCNGTCGASDGCGGFCSGKCGQWDKCEQSGNTYACVCGPADDYKLVGGVCLPSCGSYLYAKGWANGGGGCCQTGCVGEGSGYKETHDCNYCCAGDPGQDACTH